MATHEPTAGEQGPASLATFLRAGRIDLPESEEGERAYLQGLLAQLAAELERGDPDHASAWATAHAQRRLAEGLDLHQVTGEYARLRSSILARWEEGGGGSLAEVRRLDAVLDRAITTAVEEYTAATTGTLRAIDGVARVALEANSIEELLQRLLQVFVEALPAIDTATILLREGEVLRVRAEVGLEEEAGPRPAIRIGTGFAGRVAASRSPMALRSAATDPLVQSPVLRARGVRAILGVPLVADGQLIGVAHMGSLTAWEFSGHDQLLFTTLCDRAVAGISQHLLRQEAMRHAEALRLLHEVHEESVRLQGVIEQLPAGVVIAEAPGGRVLFANELAGEIWRTEPPSFRSIADYRAWRAFHLDGRPFEPEEWPIVRALRGAIVHEDLDVVRGDGTLGVVACRAGPFLGDTGEIHGAVMTLRDVTERRRSQREAHFLSELGQRLGTTLEYEEAMRTVLRSVVPAFADWAGLFRVGDDETVELFDVAHVGQTRLEEVRELVRAVLSRENAMERVARSRTAELVERITEEELASSGTGDDLARLRSLGLSSAITVPLVARGRSVGVLALATVGPGRTLDAADLKLAQEIARRAALSIDNARLFRAGEDAVRSRDRVLGVVSHDLRNPLGAILLSAEELLRTAAPGEAGEATRRGAGRIERAAGRMGRLIQDLLDLASIEAGQLSIALRRRGCEGLFRETIDAFEDQAARKQVRLVADWPEGVPELRCDRDRLIQAIGNLISNALHATPPGGSIVLRAARELSELLLSVSDTGPGIAEAELPHVFDRFFRGGGRQYKGTGLGLTIAKAIIEGHHGRIWASSRPGEGATFFVALPLASPR